MMGATPMKAGQNGNKRSKPAGAPGGQRAKRAAILEAAAKVFLGGGYLGASMDDIVMDLGGRL